MDIKTLRTAILFRAYQAPLWCVGVVAVCLLALWWTSRPGPASPRLRTVLLWAEGVGAALAMIAAVFLGLITLLFSDGLDRSIVLKNAWTTQDGTYPKGTKVSLNNSLDRIAGAELAQPTQIAGISFVGSLGIIEGPDVTRRFHGTLSHAVELYGIPCGPGEATLEGNGAFVDCQVSRTFHYTEYRSKMFVAAPDGAFCAPGPGSFSAGSLSCVLAAPATISGASLQAGDRIQVLDLGAQPDVSWTAHDPLKLFSITWPAGTKVQLKGGRERPRGPFTSGRSARSAGQDHDGIRRTGDGAGQGGRRSCRVQLCPAGEHGSGV